MTTPLPRERIEQLIAFAESVVASGSSDRGRDTLFALRELLHLREQVEALREYVDLQSNVGAVYLIRDDEERAKAQRERWDRMDALRAAIGRREDGSWEEESNG